LMTARSPITSIKRPSVRICRPALIARWRPSPRRCTALIVKPRSSVIRKESSMFNLFKSRAQWLALGGMLTLSAWSQAAQTPPDALRIGYQKGSVSMVLAKNHQLLEKRYPDTKISWVEFPAGPQMLEALNIGSIDLGSTGDIPPIFAQAAGAD